VAGNEQDEQDERNAQDEHDGRNAQDTNGSMGPQPSRRDKRLYFVLMTTCIGLFVLSWAVLDRYSTIAAVVVTLVALAIPPFAVIIANAASATDRRRP
jgi:hypothetical protein